MTGDQVRRARRLLGWSAVQLAATCSLRAWMIRIYERTGHMPHPMFQRTNPEERFTELRGALEAAGIEFTNGDAPGVRLRKGGE